MKDKTAAKASKTVLGQTIAPGRIGKNRVIPDSRKALAVAKVLKCEPTAYSQILEVERDSSKEAVHKAYSRLAVLTDLKSNKIKCSSEVYNCKCAASSNIR